MTDSLLDPLKPPTPEDIQAWALAWFKEGLNRLGAQAHLALAMIRILTRQAVELCLDGKGPAGALGDPSLHVEAELIERSRGIMKGLPPEEEHVLQQNLEELLVTYEGLATLSGWLQRDWEGALRFSDPTIAVMLLGVALSEGHPQAAALRGQLMRDAGWGRAAWLAVLQGDGLGDYLALLEGETDPLWILSGVVVTCQALGGAPDGTQVTGRTRWQSSQVTGTALAQLRGNPLCPEISHVASELASIQLVQGWTFGPHSPLRQPADSGLPSDRLEADGRNLPLLLHRLREDGAAWTRIRDALRDLYPRLDDVETSIDGQTVKMILREEGLPVPASRISDGTLRWLGLLALLLDPSPAPLICLEEPELGLHPDLISTLADLLKDAAQRTQLVITTHSDILVSEFSPEDVVVCERQTGASVLRRLDPVDLEPWLEEFSLGHAWPQPLCAPARAAPEMALSDRVGAPLSAHGPGHRGVGAGRPRGGPVLLWLRRGGHPGGRCGVVDPEAARGDPA